MSPQIIIFAAKKAASFEKIYFAFYLDTARQHKDISMYFTVRGCSEVIKRAVDFETPFAVFSMPISEKFNGTAGENKASIVINNFGIDEM